MLRRLRIWKLKREWMLAAFLRDYYQELHEQMGAIARQNLHILDTQYATCCAECCKLKKACPESWHADLHGHTLRVADIAPGIMVSGEADPGMQHPRLH